MKDQYAILRVQKIKSFSAISAMSRHWHRTQNTFNSVTNRQIFNKTIKGSGDVLKDINTLFMDKKTRQFRKNGVLALEFVLTFSPDYIYQNDRIKLQENAKERLNLWFKSSLNWIEKSFGENCTSIVYHADESTPHIHFAVAPIKMNAKDQYTLCAKDITGGRHKLRELQDSYHNEVKCCGLRRGIKREKPKTHQSLKDYYSSIYHIEEKLLEKGLSSVDQSGKVNAFKDAIEKLISLKNDEKLSLIKKFEQLIRHILRQNQSLKNEIESYRKAAILKR